jgi:hypothetical protein
MRGRPERCRNSVGALRKISHLAAGVPESQGPSCHEMKCSSPPPLDSACAALQRILVGSFRSNPPLSLTAGAPSRIRPSPLNRGHSCPSGVKPPRRRQAFGTCSNLPAQWGGSGGRSFGVAAAGRFECHSTAKQREQILTSPLQISCGRARHSLQKPSSVNTGAAGTGKPVHAAACCR